MHKGTYTYNITNYLLFFKGKCESPVPQHIEKELVQLQSLLGDVFKTSLLRLMT